jgi:protein TonB
MNNETILKSDVLDILFDKRNKAYGAYNLRKFYNNRLIKSLAVMLTGVVVLSAFTFLPKKEKPILGIDNEGLMVHTIKLPEEPLKKEKPKALPKNEVKQQPVEQRIFVNNIQITKAPTVDTINTLIDGIVISTLNVTVPSTGGSPTPVLLVPVVTGDGVGIKPKPQPDLDVSKTFTENEVEVMPSYPGGMNALRKFLVRNLENPRDMEEGEVANVKVKFVVGSNGELQSFVTVQDGGNEFNREVMRVLKKMPNWVPGKSKGQNVSVFYTIPIKFISAD